MKMKRKLCKVRGSSHPEKFGFAYLFENGDVSSPTHYVRIFERLGLTAGDGIQYYNTGNASWEIVLCPF